MPCPWWPICEDQGLFLVARVYYHQSAVVCGLSLLVLYSAPRGFFPGSTVIPAPLTRNQHLNLFCYDLICFVHDPTSYSALEIKVTIIVLYFSEEYCYWIGGGCRALGNSSQRRLLFLLVITWRVHLQFQCSRLVDSRLQGRMVAVLVTSSKYVGVRLPSVLGELSRGACGKRWLWNSDQTGKCKTAHICTMFTYLVSTSVKTAPRSFSEASTCKLISFFWFVG